MTFKTLISKLTIYKSYIGIAVWLGTSVIAYNAIVAKKAIEKYSVDKQNEQMITDVKETKEKTDSILLILTDQGALLNTVIEKQNEQKDAYNALRNIVLDHQATTIEEFKKLNNEVPILKKKLTSEK